MPTNEQVLKRLERLQDCAISEKGWHEEGEIFLGKFMLVKRDSKDGERVFSKMPKKSNTKLIQIL